MGLAAGTGAGRNTKMFGWLRTHPVIVAAVAITYFIAGWFIRPIITLNIETWAASEGADRLFASPIVVNAVNILVSFYIDYIAANTGPFALGVAVCALLFGFQDWRSRQAAKGLLARLKPYVKHVSGRLRYANAVCDGEKDAEVFYKKIVLQQVDMAAIVGVDISSLTGAQREALEQLGIEYRELRTMVDYSKGDGANLTYEHIAHLYRQRAQKLARALNQLIIELSGGTTPPSDLVPDPSTSPRGQPESVSDTLSFAESGRQDSASPGDKEAEHELTLFVTDYVLPLCEAQRDLQEAIIRNSHVNPEVVDLAKQSLMSDYSVHQFGEHYKYFCERLASSPFEGAPLDELKKRILRMDKSYRSLCDQTDRLAAESGLDYRTHPELVQYWQELRANHNELVKAYWHVKRDRKFAPELYRPGINGPWTKEISDN